MFVSILRFLMYVYASIGVPLCIVNALCEKPVTIVKRGRVIYFIKAIINVLIFLLLVRVI